MATTPTGTLTPLEKEILHLVLEGQSVIDWPRLHFDSPEEATSFLKVNEFDVNNPKDVERLGVIHSQAVDYLERELKLTLDETLKEKPNMASLLLTASRSEGIEIESQACALLKTMNIINHIDGRELLYNCPISLRDLFSLVEDKIERTLSALNLGQTGAPPLPVRYKGGRKPKESLITKLLCRRETIASQIYDRVRYRIVTRTREDITKVVLHLFETVLPFNYVIPGASVNQLVPDSAGAAEILPGTLKDTGDYTGRNYKVCKFVVDIPIRMEKFLASSGSHFYRDTLGTLVYVLVEFQIVDEATDATNNSGESRHDEYKKRQKSGVLKRLIS